MFFTSHEQHAYATKSKLKKIIIGVIISSIILALFIWHFLNKTVEFNYHTVFVSSQTLERTTTVMGKLEALKIAKIGTQNSGKVQQIFYKAGDRVKKGDLLLIIDAREEEKEIQQLQLDFMNKEQELQKYQLKLIYLQDKLKKESDLAQKNAIEETKIIELKKEIKDQEIDLKIKENELSKLKIGLEKQRLKLEETQIISPIAGEITQLRVEEGQVVNGMHKIEELLRVEDLSMVKINLFIPEADVPDLKPQLPVSFTLLGNNKKKYNSYLEPQLPVPQKESDDKSSKESNYYTVTIIQHNSDNLFRSAMTVKATITLQRLENVLTIPLSALGKKITENSYTVRVLNTDKQVQQKEVIIGLRTATYVQILSGLEEGEQVIIREQSNYEEKA